jgi:DHA3 family macrolide efflux protein-like MFS transporter
MDENNSHRVVKNWATPFFTIWTGQAVSLLGSQLVQFALIWWLTKTTGSATVLATATLVGLLPQILLGPIAGAFVDRLSRRAIMIIADSVIALATVLLAYLFWSDLVQIWQVYLLMFIRALAGSFHWPAMQASTSLMVPKEHFSRIQGLNQTLNGGMNIISAPLGALLLEVLSIQGVLAIDVVTAMVAVLPLFFIPVPQPQASSSHETEQDKTSVWDDFRVGLRYMFSWPGLLLIAVMAMVINLVLTPAFSLVPILVTKHFSGEALQLAWLDSAAGIGIIAGGLILSVWGGFQRRIKTTLLGLMIIGAGCLFIGFLPPSAYPIAIVATFSVGLGIAMTDGPILAVLQDVIAPEMQGRVFTLFGSLVKAMTPIGLIIAGPVADIFGVQTWFIMGGIVTGLLGLMGFFLPAVTNIGEGKNVDVPLETEKPAIAASPINGD